MLGAEELRKLVRYETDIEEQKVRVEDLIMLHKKDRKINIDMKYEQDYVAECIVKWLKELGYYAFVSKGFAGHDGDYCYVHVEW